MPINQVITSSRVPVKVWTDELEPKAREQLLNLANLPFIYRHIAAMPDVHLGIGATVGSVVPTKGAIIPSAVGVDIGCGMNAMRTKLRAEDLPDDLSEMRVAIEKAVPVGFSSFKVIPNASLRVWHAISGAYERIIEKHPHAKANNVSTQLGTLGGGNHFIEVCLDESGAVWLMLHSGSRGAGNRIGTYFIDKAREEMERMFIHLPDRDLAYFAEGSVLFDDYVEAVSWAQTYANYNRELMMENVRAAVSASLDRLVMRDSPMVINCHHNYVEMENHFGANVLLTRKGAIRARVGDLGIIPGSMGTRSYIVRGKGNPESFNSCSHGAGRRMSRGQAEKTFTVDDLATQTAGVECRKDKGVLDEIPGAYKDVEKVMEHQSDLVEILHTLKQVLCVKG